jgi:hypothetical protein
MKRGKCPATGKLMFEDERRARAALVGCIMARNRGRTYRAETDVYECPKCHSWHLTSMAQPKRAKTT